MGNSDRVDRPAAWDSLKSSKDLMLRHIETPPPATSVESEPPPVSVEPRSPAQTRLDRLIAIRGARYATCTLVTFVAATQKQRDVLATVKGFNDRLKEHISAGDNLVLFGPPGTGKDHLMFALMGRAVFRLGFSAKDALTSAEMHREYGNTLCWTRAESLFQLVRESLRDESPLSEREIAGALSKVGVLAISDMLHPSGPLTEFQQQFLYEVIDERYSRCLPTWLTVNASGRDELNPRMGPALYDRLRDRALGVFCEWESYRSPLQPLRLADTGS